MTVSDIVHTIETLDMINRPYALFIHPDHVKEIKSLYPELEERYFVVATENVGKEKAVLIKREELNQWIFGKGDQE